MDNAESEYAFISEFFGHHSSLPLLPKRASPTLLSSSSHSSRSTPSNTSPTLPTIVLPGNDVEERSETGARRSSLDDGSEWGSDRLGGSSRATSDGRSVKLRRTVVDGIWKSVMEPALEYARVRPLFTALDKQGLTPLAEFFDRTPRSDRSLPSLAPHDDPTQRRAHSTSRHGRELSSDGNDAHGNHAVSLALLFVGDERAGRESAADQRYRLEWCHHHLVALYPAVQRDRRADERRRFLRRIGLFQVSRINLSREQY